MWQKIARSGEARAWRGNIPIHHRYTLGVAGERFFKALRDEKQLLGARCPKCRQVMLPPKIYCERCFEETTEWLPISGLGHVRTYTILHRSLDEEPLRRPVIVALIGWEGVRGGLVHRLGEVTPSQMRSGMQVAPVWSDNRTGSLEDIRYFRPTARA